MQQVEQAISHTARFGKQHVCKLKIASLSLIFIFQPCTLEAQIKVRVSFYLVLQEMKVHITQLALH